VKVVVAGGAGWLGSALCRSLAADGHDVVVLSRSPSGSRPGLRIVAWDGRTQGDWSAEIAGADAVVNFAGAPIAPHRWTPSRKELLTASRVEPTAALVAAIDRARPQPAVLVNTSAIGFYGDCGDEIVAEDEPPGHDFLAQLAARWEAEALRARSSNVRVVLPRVGVVFGRGGGALPFLALPFRLFVGGPLGSGKQWVPWVHLEDVVGAYRHAIDNASAEGPINLTAPEPAMNHELAGAIAYVLGRPSWVPAPGWAIRLALGELAITVLAGQRAASSEIERLGYRFLQPALIPALRQALQ
jgi:hypothetical protein